MKIKLTLLFAVCVYCEIYAQRKEIIDTNMLGTWPGLNRNVCMSQNGKYAAFVIDNMPFKKKTLVIQDLFDDRKKEIVTNEITFPFYFSKDCKKLVWQKGDSLLMESTRDNSVTSIGAVSQYLFPRINKGEWIVFKEKGTENILVLLNLITGRREEFKNVTDVSFDSYGTTLLLESTIEKQNTLKWVNLKSNKEVNIWSGRNDATISGIEFDKNSNQLSFLVIEPYGASVYYYKVGMDRALKKLDDQNQSLTNGLKISSIKGFSENGKYLFINLEKAKQLMPKSNPNLASVDIWSYKDEILHPRQTKKNRFSRLGSKVELVIDVAENKDGILLNSDELNICSLAFGDHIILTSDTLPDREYWWPHAPKPSEWVASLKDGSRRPLLKERTGISSLSASPGGRWFTWWDEEHALWMIYEIATGEIRNLSSFLPYTLATEAEYRATIVSSPVAPIAGWFTNDSFLLVYDNYDIWKLDPYGKKSAINITKGYGRRNKIELRLLNEHEDEERPIIYVGNENVILVGYNQENKYNGFFRINLGKAIEPELLSMGPVTWYRHQSQAFPTGLRPIKGGVGHNSGWILVGQSDKEFPNYYYTQDFKKYKALTNLCPQKKYNWLTTALLTWDLPDGRKSQGILFKPESLDSNKKYPVIFNFYEKESHNMYKFPMPGLTGADINIPWYVSRGYLVFTPDIYYGNGSKTGLSSGHYALNAVESAINVLGAISYVDTTRMAINGHSFGGLETNYILTHSKRFVAAAEGAGFTDVMSSYLTLTGDALVNSLDIQSNQEHKERDHELYGATPWERPDLYLDNSAVWSADKTSAPLLIFHNKDDDQVQWRQGVEMYMALRRLGKPCWMLQYDKGKHILWDRAEAKDYTIRLTQFLDHYLKGLPAPLWMTQGVPAQFKQIENRYELDSVGTCFKDCKVCKYWSQKSKSDMGSKFK